MNHRMISYELQRAWEASLVSTTIPWNGYTWMPEELQPIKIDSQFREKFIEDEDEQN